MSFNWNGAALVEKVGKAALAAIDETTAAAAERAGNTQLDIPKSNIAGYWWFDLTPRTERVFNEIANRSGGRVSGRFGTVQRRGGYGLFEERVFPFLRPAKDAEFPKLTSRIRARLR